jgi:hypothetical protein
MRKRSLLLVLLLPVIGTLLASAQGNRYSGSGETYAALREQPRTQLLIGGGEINVVFADGAPGLDRDRVLAWIRGAAVAVSTYFGRFPVAKVGILVVAENGSGVGSGTTYGYAGSAIRIVVGRDASEARFKNDWILVHEMTHLALPDVPSRSRWLLEGNATYVEPIARAQAGQIDATEVWRWSLEGMPKGLPELGDRGLDYTATWGRTYWGGALFWLMADIKIREETQNRCGVQDALRAINRASGGNTADWSVEQILRVGDRATGSRVLSTLYREMKATPQQTDLSLLFGKLGVAEQQGEILFDDAAPLAAIRHQITKKEDLP